MSADTQHFTGTDQYIATDSLKLAVKAARALQKSEGLSSELGIVPQDWPPQPRTRSRCSVVPCFSCGLVLDCLH
jgi:hypothetical protein